MTLRSLTSVGLSTDALATDHQREDIRRRLAALPADIAQTVLDGAR